MADKVRSLSSKDQAKNPAKGKDKPGLKARLKVLGGQGEKPRPQRRGKRELTWLARLKTRPFEDSRAQRWVLAMILAAALAFLVFPTVLTRVPDYRLGEVVARDVKASQTFLVEDAVSTEERRKEAEAKVRDVYDFDDWLAESTVNRVRQAFGLVRSRPLVWGGKLHEPGADVEPLDPSQIKAEEAALKAEFQALLGTDLENSQWSLLKKAGFTSEIEEAVVGLLRTVLWNEIVPSREQLLEEEGKGITVRTISNNQERVLRDLWPVLSTKTAAQRVRTQALSLNLNPLPYRRLLRPLVAGIAVDLLRPNLSPNRHETQKRRQAAREAVKPVFQKVQRGEMVAREGQIITPQILARLNREAETRPSQLPWLQFTGMFFLLLVLLRFLYLPGLIPCRGGSSRGKDLAFISLTIFLVFALARLGIPVLAELARDWSPADLLVLSGALPVAAGAMLVCVFLGLEAALLTGLALAFLAAHLTEARLEYFVLFLVTSLVGSRPLVHLPNRGASLKAGLWAGLAGMVVAGATHLTQGNPLSLSALAEIGAALLGGFLAGVIVSGMIPLVEMVFGYTTDFRLLELANLDQPNLKDLLIQAPGTYHHSIVVGNMVEAAAETIRANPLLAKVAAYYHDVGKVSKPLYFIENQISGENRHEKLAPSMSSLILIAHVKSGVEIARKAKLDRRIVDIIAQHHGTSVIKYFYDKAVKLKGEKEEIKLEDFRYPGPKPQTREAGLVMLADQVEAASRSLTDPTPARVQGMVQKIINQAFVDDQLSDCELTLKDLHSIAKSFNQVLNGIFHHRVAYPEAQPRTGQAKRKPNGDSGPKRADKGNGGSEPSETEDKDNLKRLGLV